MPESAIAAPPSLPPRWIIRTIWRAHRFVVRVTGGRLGLFAPTPSRAGMLRLNTVGRTTGLRRSVIVCYVADGPDLVTLAMNGWDAPEPSWWRNLQAEPLASVDVAGGTRSVLARAAVGEERTRLWQLAQSVAGWGDDLEAMASLRGGVETAVSCSSLARDRHGRARGAVRARRVGDRVGARAAERHPGARRGDPGG